MFRSAHVGFLNIRSLRPNDLSTDDGKELYMRRIEKQTVAIAGNLLGLDPCPFPLCALRTAETDAELDQKARGLCPPCYCKALQILGVEEAAPALPAGDDKPSE